MQIHRLVHAVLGPALAAAALLLSACGGSDNPPMPPTITSQPANVTVTEPATATFSVAATPATEGTALTYQWQRQTAGTWTNVPGATAASYTTPATTRAADNGAQFRVVVGTGMDMPAVTSSAATLTVDAPAVAWQAATLVTGGGSQTLAIRANGELWSWGLNNDGALGRADGDTVTTPSQVTALGNTVRSVAAGATYSVALLANGTVWAWGSSDRIGAAVGSPLSTRLPLQVTGLTGMRAISTRYWHTLALRDDGTVWGFGPENFGALGPAVGNGAARQLAGLSNVRQVSAGEQHSIALLADGTVRTWGSNTLGQLGVDSGGAQRTAPQTVPLTNVTAVAATSFASFALRSDGTLWRWGSFAGTTLNVPTQVTAPGGGTITRLAPGNHHLHILRSDNTLFGFGENSLGRVGIGTTGGQVTTPTQLSGIGTVSDVGAGEFHGLALRSDGRVFSWGHNGSRQLRGIAGPDTNTPQDTSFTR